jgi:hypothetical protein
MEPGLRQMPVVAHLARPGTPAEMRHPDLVTEDACVINGRTNLMD